MKIGFVDCDKKNNKNPFPNLALMKLSAWHKKQGDSVEWYEPMFSGHMDKVYVSKVFSFSPDYEYFIDADEIIYGGSGFAISMIDGKEVYDKTKDAPLPTEIEHIYPDYSLYNIQDTAYGFLTRGCPRGCEFCHVKSMQGSNAHRVAYLNEFWNGQKNIVLLDPNISAHFAWDRYEDKDIVYPKLKEFAEITQWNKRKIVVYCLVGDKERRVTEQDIKRIMLLREFAYPYVTIYDKASLPKGHELRKLQRWVNNRFVWEAVPTFEEYQKENKE